MEDILYDEFQSFCKFNCEYRDKKGFDVKIDIDVDKYCYSCGDDNVTADFQYENISPCNFCQIEEFIREIGGRI